MAPDLIERIDLSNADIAIPLPPSNRRQPKHVLERESILAVNTALACGRPLLVRGEPGTGKSQLASAVAVVLNRELKSRVVDARTEPHELMWEYDALGRLADVQAYKEGGGCKPERADYTIPGPLWWAFDWQSAARQAKILGQAETPKRGVVLLIDEIDKADMAVPNALLESLGNGCFRVPGLTAPVEAHPPMPLVVLTTNTERMLPDAFVRRCVVLHMRVPKKQEKDGEGLVSWLVRRGQAHFGLDQDLLELAADMVATAREQVLGQGIHCPPGLAEYIDLLTAIAHEPAVDAKRQLKSIGRFVLSKHRDPGGMPAQKVAERSSDD